MGRREAELRGLRQQIRAGEPAELRAARAAALVAGLAEAEGQGGELAAWFWGRRTEAGAVVVRAVLGAAVAAADRIRPGDDNLHLAEGVLGRVLERAGGLADVC